MHAAIQDQPMPACLKIIGVRADLSAARQVDEFQRAYASAAFSTFLTGTQFYPNESITHCAYWVVQRSGSRKYGYPAPNMNGQFHAWSKFQIP